MPGASNPFGLPMFVGPDRVVIQVSNRIAFGQLWVSGLSAGGLFAPTTSPPPLGTTMAVILQDGTDTLELSADVVHQTEGEGFGLHVTDIDAPSRARIEGYIEGTAHLGVGDDVLTPEETDDLIDEALRIIDALERGNVYQATNTTPDMTVAQIDATIAAQTARLSNTASLSPPKRARIETALRRLDQAAALLRHPTKRVQYDFQHGHVRVRERMLAKENPDRLREVWRSVFPERIDEAETLAVSALEAETAGNRTAASKALERALKLDPFNTALRQLRTSWRATAPNAADSASPKQREVEERSGPRTGG